MAASAKRGNSNVSSNNNSNKNNVLSIYFFVIIFFFSLLTLWLEGVGQELNGQTKVMEKILKESRGTESDVHQKQNTQQQKQTDRLPPTAIAGLNCAAYGGPSQEAAQEMIYWQDIPSDSEHISPLKKKEKDVVEYLTFEPDHGGFNNIRMAMETVLALAMAMGRTLVLPPEKDMYLLTKSDGSQRNQFSFHHFFPMESIHYEHAGFDIITMEEFLKRESLTGRLRNTKGQVVFPPDNNRTDWDGLGTVKIAELFDWLRENMHGAPWDPETCIAAFPASPSEDNIKELRELETLVAKENPPFEQFVAKPPPVNATALYRLREMWGERKSLCIYDGEMQNAKVVHFISDSDLNIRQLVHFYAFLFFQDWKQDLWMKRFVRDHVRYTDEIQCAAARVVQAVRDRARLRDNNNNNNPTGKYDSAHIRRGDFQYVKTRVEAPELIAKLKRNLKDGTTLFIATDERNKAYFEPFKKHYDIVFLDDFKHLLEGVNTNYYGMIDQLVASRGDIFYGCWFSTFSGYINRIRGYHADKNKEPGYEQGIVKSWYYAPDDRYDWMQTYFPVKKSFYAREFPTSWRLIDSTLEH